MGVVAGDSRPYRRGVAFRVLAPTQIGAGNRGRYDVRIDATPGMQAGSTRRVCTNVPSRHANRSRGKYVLSRFAR
jgi:hypothetical protein